jgi:hypothetical protein
MTTITLPERELVSRANSLHKIFMPLREQRDRIAFDFAKGSPGGTKVLVATDQAQGSRPRKGESFRTSVKSLRCNYSEEWRVVEHDTFALHHAYFTLLRVKQSSTEFDEILCLHTDPGDDAEFKKGPHLHVSCAEQPIPHCHFPLDLGSLPTVLKDSDALTSAIARAIRVVAEEVVPRFGQ